MLKTKRQIFVTVNNTTFRLSEIMFEDQSPSLSSSVVISMQQSTMPIKSEKFIGSELTFVSTQLIFSLDEPRDRSPARL